jgi:hypothetical protein
MNDTDIALLVGRLEAKLDNLQEDFTSTRVDIKSIDARLKGIEDIKRKATWMAAGISSLVGFVSGAAAYFKLNFM